MSATPRSPDPDLDAEREVDLGRYLDALVARWWLPLAGLVVGVLLGYVLALGGKEVWKAEATVYVGTPYGPSGIGAIQTLATNPSTVTRIARGQETIEEAAQKAGMTPRQLRSGLSTRVIKTGTAKTAPNQIYVVSVKGNRREKVTTATNEVADRVVEGVGGYARQKIDTFKQEIASDNRQLTAIDDQIEATTAAMNGSASQIERLTMGTLLLTAEQRRGTLEQDRLQTRQLLALAEQVELPHVIDHGAAVKTTARSTRNSAAVAGLIGLIVGILAALFWEPVATRAARTR
jgi:uncharacterized protein involved in exopolysaccharide biosynthesis